MPTRIGSFVTLRRLESRVASRLPSAEPFPEPKRRRARQQQKPVKSERPARETPEPEVRVSMQSVIALKREGKEFASESARKKYLREHPKADPKKHTVVKRKKKPKALEPKVPKAPKPLKPKVPKVPKALEPKPLEPKVPGAPEEAAPAPKAPAEAAPAPAAQAEPAMASPEKYADLPEVAATPGITGVDDLFDLVPDAHEQQLDFLDRGTGIDSMIDGSVARGDEVIPPLVDQVDAIKETAESEGRELTSEETASIKDLTGQMDKFFSDAVSQEGPVIIIGPTKSMERSLEKVGKEGDWAGLVDTVRASIAVDSFDDLKNLTKTLEEKGMKLASQPTDRFATPTNVGYRDVKLNVEFPNGLVGELQLHVKPMIEAKAEGHHYYGQVRTIEARAKAEGSRDLTEEEQAVVDDANAKQLKLYNTAWEKVAGG